MRVYRFAKLQRCLTFATSRIVGLWQRAYDSDEMAGLIPYRVVRHETMTKEKISPSTPQPCDEAARTRQELLDEYIEYYNHDRRKLKLKGLSPIDHRMRFASN